MIKSELEHAIEIIPDRLYWVEANTPPKHTTKSHYFSIDSVLVYEAFFADFGPLNLSMVYRYVKLLDAKIADPALADKRIIHFCSPDPKKRANAAFLISAYQVIVMGRPAELAYEPFRGISPPFAPFRDACNGACSFQLTILDCLKGLEKSIEIGWFDWKQFDVDVYDYMEKVEHGDMSWIIPDKFLAFAGPSASSKDSDGFPAFTPEDYVPMFKKAGIGHVVRLNARQYDRRRFADHGIKHSELYFPDGACPTREIIAKFLEITESERSAVAVHCKAGLGRTGTLIGLYAMKHHCFPARAFIGWIRLCRPGSILGPQQQFLLEMQAEMFQAGASRRLSNQPLPAQGEAGCLERALVQQAEGLSLKERSQAEQHEDPGQGERLRQAKLKGSAPARRATVPLAGAGASISPEMVLPPVGRLNPDNAVGQLGGEPPSFVGKQRSTPVAGSRPHPNAACAALPAPWQTPTGRSRRGYSTSTIDSVFRPRVSMTVC